MKWEQPTACDMRFGFEITMYIANRCVDGSTAGQSGVGPRHLLRLRAGSNRVGAFRYSVTTGAARFFSPRVFVQPS